MYADEYNDKKRKLSKTSKNKRDKAKAERRTLAKRNARPTKKTIFPFLDLPAELRNTIYQMALEDPNDMTIISKTKILRRVTVRGLAKTYTDDVGYHRRHRVRPTPDPSKPRVELSPALLAVNRQINTEGGTVLYSQKLHLEDMVAVYQFLTQVGHANRQLIRDITVHGWGEGRGVHKSLNHPAFSMLAGVTNLRRLFLDCRVEYGVAYRSWPVQHHQTRSLVSMATRFYRDGHNWLDAVGVATGNRDAALDILELADCNFGPQFEKDRTDEEIEADDTKLKTNETTFREYLKTMLKR